MAVAVEVVRCPHCQGSAVVKYGTASNGKARYRCQQAATCGRMFLRTYADPGCQPEVKQQMVEMTLNGSGIRDIARVLRVGPTTVIKELKKSGGAVTGEQSRGRGVLS
jgi:transposase-like protein